MINCIKMFSNRLLIVDNEAGARDLISNVANEIGYEVRATDDSDELHSLLRDFRPGTLIIDLNLPKLDGIELLSMIGAIQYQGAVLVTSGADSRVLAAAQRSGTSHGLKMLGVLHKPLSLSDVRGTLQTVRTSQRVTTESDLRKAIEMGQLIVHYQPKVVRQQEGPWQIKSAEALVRWQHPEFGLIMPMEFIPLAEEVELISPMTDYLLRTAVEQMRVWHDSGMEVNVAIRVATDLMSDLCFPDRLMALLNEYSVDSSRLTLQVAECTAMMASQHTVDVLTRLRLKDIQLSVDDFGRGCSSLSKLFRSPFSELKIDRSFVMDVGSSAEARTIVKALINLAHNLDMSVCAEGVETQESWDFLDAEGCDTAQGYLFSEPISAAKFEKLFHRRNSAPAMITNELYLVTGGLPSDPKISERK